MKGATALVWLCWLTFVVSMGVLGFSAWHLLGGEVGYTIPVIVWAVASAFWWFVAITFTDMRRERRQAIQRAARRASLDRKTKNPDWMR